MIRLIVGLGNPGKSYQNTRHNAGAWLIEQLCREHGVILRLKTAFHGQYANLQLAASLTVHLVIPATFMNKSGHAVSAIARYYKITLQEILIVHDELDFPPGVAKIKLGGGLGGHNGLRDIGRILGSNNFWRLRIGIGHPGDKEKVPQYVLDAPESLELTKIKKTIKDALTVLPDLCQGQEERAMQILHSEGIIGAS